MYTGEFGPEQAERLLWRAGFGPRSGEAEHLAAKGLHAAVDSLVNPPKVDTLVGKTPLNNGHPLAPKDNYGDDHLWWLDKMVRTSRPLVERMALIWHDWFATSNETVGSQKLMLEQNELFRQIGLGSFLGLTMRVTINPAMLLYLNGLNSIKGSPNENYGREMMELFTLGVGRGYTETDVRENARALTGWTANWKNGAGFVDFHFKAENHDAAMKVIFGHVGAVQLEELRPALRPAPRSRRLLREPALELLRPGRARSEDRGRAREALRRLRLADPPGRGGDPPAPDCSTRARGW